MFNRPPLLSQERGPFFWPRKPIPPRVAYRLPALWFYVVLVTYSNKECAVTVNNIDPDFEASFLKQRVADLHRTHPGEAVLVADILQALNYQKTAIRKELQVRGLVIALGYTLSRKGATGLPGLEGWLGQFLKNGALSSEQVVAFTAQAKVIYRDQQTGAVEGPLPAEEQRL